MKRAGTYITIYIIAITALFIYVLFPSEKFGEFIAYHAASGMSGIAVEINDVKPTLLPGIRLKKIHFLLQPTGLPIAGIKGIKVSPHYTSIFKAGKGFNFKSGLFGGNISGHTIFLEKNSITVINLNEINIDRIEALGLLTEQQLSGLLSGKIDYTLSSAAGREALATLKLINGALTLSEPFFTIESISFEKIESEILLSNDIIRIKSCTLKGAQIDGTLSGGITLKTPLEKSRLTLSGMFKPHHTLLASLSEEVSAAIFQQERPGTKGFSFTIGGTFDKLDFNSRK
ncbi:MAG: type II secretion system protein GspN [Desulfobacterales bacterium]|nr:type II secretion system protein GspN [Desulfobacterales bacterium]